MPLAVAADGIEAQHVCHLRPPRRAPRSTGPAPGVARNSSAKTRRALCNRPAAPSGWWHARVPRPGRPIGRSAAGRRPPPHRRRAVGSRPRSRRGRTRRAALRGALASHERHDLRGRTNPAVSGPANRYAPHPEADPIGRPVGRMRGRSGPPRASPSHRSSRDQDGSGVAPGDPGSVGDLAEVVPYSIHGRRLRTAPLTVTNAVPAFWPRPAGPVPCIAVAVR